MRNSILAAARRWRLVGLVILLLGIGINAVFRAGFDDAVRTDVSVYRAAGAAALEHASIYDARNERGSPYVYPPFTALVSIPLAWIPMPVAAALFYLFSLGALATAVWLGGRCLVRGPSAARTLRHASTACALLFIDVFSRGQVGHWILLGLVIALWGWLRGRAAIAGLALGAALSIKPTPAALLLLFFAWRREWRFVLWSVLGACAGLWLVPSLYFGPIEAGRLLVVWTRDVLYAAGGPGSIAQMPGGRPGDYLGLAEPTLPNNQSILAGATRLLLLLGGRDTPALRTLARALAAAAAATLLFLSRKSWTLRVTGDRRIVQFGLPVVTLLVTAPLARDDYFVALVPSVLGLLACRAEQTEEGRRRTDRVLVPAAVLVLLPLLIPQLRPAAPMGAGTLLLWVLSQRAVLAQPDATDSRSRIQPKSASTTMV
ncbi:MAG: glycosyltransferase family 87 protein [Candidatus Eisenbacteria bacterium]